MEVISGMYYFADVSTLFPSFLSPQLVLASVVGLLGLATVVYGQAQAQGQGGRVGSQLDFQYGPPEWNKQLNPFRAVEKKVIVITCDNIPRCERTTMSCVSSLSMF